jgi:hypothetical protein
MVSLEFFIDIILPAGLRNEYQEYILEGKVGRYVGLITFLHSCVDCLEIWQPQAPGTLRACARVELFLDVSSLAVLPTNTTHFSVLFVQEC